MSIRRKSFDSCFKARRKCDLTYPVCERCDRNSKKCHYAYPPQLDVVDTIAAWPATGAVSSSQVSSLARPPRSGVETLQLTWLRHSSVPKLLGLLGDLPPVTAPEGWTWLSDEIREYPLTFANQAETAFIHRDIYRNSFPRPLQAAFGICAGILSMNERNRSVLFQALGAELSGLLTPVSMGTLLVELAKLQATVLFQIIRLFYGDLEQRIVAERQEYLFRSFALKLLHRADTELQSTQRTWETWVLAESVRRAVIVAFKLHTVYSRFQYGVCAEAAALGILPVSTILSSWNSKAAFLQDISHERTTTCGGFVAFWSTASQETAEPFEKLLLVGCASIEGLEAMAGSSKSPTKEPLGD